MNNTILNLGWTCPSCHRCFSPMTIECPYCGQNAKTEFSYTEVNFDGPNERGRDAKENN